MIPQRLIDRITIIAASQKFQVLQYLRLHIECEAVELSIAEWNGSKTHFPTVQVTVNIYLRHLEFLLHYIE